MIKYDILAIDIDDTLLPPNGVISIQNRRAIALAINEGVIVTIATGRGYLASKPIWELLKIRGPVINYGGALIMNTMTDMPMMTTEIASELVTDVLETAKRLNIHGHIYQGDTIVYESENEYGRRYAEKLGLPFEIDGKIMEKKWRNVPKVLMMTTEEHAKELLPELKEQYSGRLQVAASSPGFIEFNCLNAQKGSALKELAKYYGVPMGRVAAIGDNSLDLEMIRAAGLGAAVGDAQPEILAAARVITPPCAEDGVAWLINKKILGKDRIKEW